MKAVKNLMYERLGGNQELIEKLVPEWSLGCEYHDVVTNLLCKVIVFLTQK